MILTLELEYFLQHTHATFNFTKGLNAIRGRNEGGKTSILLGILYALFGSRVLPLSMEETVTWGHQLRNLKVVLTMHLGDDMYVFVRTPSGAECRHSGGIVTGQKEVSKFAAELLGADAERAGRLMVASQKSMAAALEGGPTALSEYIEDMSGMFLFDILIEEAATHWPTGPTNDIDIKIADVEERLTAPLPAAPDFSKEDEEAMILQGELAAAEKGLEEVMKPSLQDATDRYNQAVIADKSRQDALSNVHRASTMLLQHMNQLEEAEAAAATPVDLERIRELDHLIRDSSLQQEAITAYTKFRGLIRPEQEWEGSMDEMLAELETQESIMSRAQKTATELRFKIRESRAHIVSSSNCTWCGQDYSKYPSIAEKNAEIEASCAVWEKEAEDAQNMYVEAKQSVQVLRFIKDKAQVFNEFHARFHAYLDRDDSMVPCKLTWNRDIPGAVVDVCALQQELSTLTAARDRKVKATTQLETLHPLVVEEGHTVEALNNAVPAEVDVEGLLAERNNLRNLVHQCEVHIGSINHKLDQIERHKQQLQIAYERDKALHDEYAQRLIELKEHRQKLMFHNSLLKKIKTARPIVAAKLWAVVLASASVMFTQMRGHQSIITRSADQFLVNGRPVKGLSGSATDILGMALRVALVKTFIPQCPFMILDEPMSACDKDRTEALLNFITCSKFDQLLLVTHEDISADWSDNLIQI